MLLLCALIVGSGTMWAENKTNVSTVSTKFSANGDVTSNFTQTGNFTPVNWNLDVTWKTSTKIYWGNLEAKGSQIGSGSNPASTVVLTGTNVPGTIKSVKVNTAMASGGTISVGVSVGGTTFKCSNSETAALATSSADYDFTGSGSGDVVITWNQPSTSKAIYIKSVTITYEEAGDPSAPSISASDVDIDYDATDGSIAYTINNGVDGGTVSAAIKDGNWITLGEGTASPISFTCSANSETTARTATVTLTYTYNTTETVTKDVTITQAAAPVVYTTIPALFAAATSTETEVKVTFNNWVVSSVSTSGKNVFVTDNSGNGFMIYSSSDQSSTYSVGDILSGTAVPCSLVLYSGYAEIIGLDASDLTITSGGTVSASNIAMADLAGVNTGALVSYNGLTCSIDNNKYYLTDGTTTIQLHNSLYAYEALEAGEKYNITGIYQQYNSTKEILPRSENDIVKIVVPKHTLHVEATNGSVEIADQTLDENGECKIKEGASVTATATPAEHYTFTSWTASFTLEDATANPLTFTMPTEDASLTATFTEDPKHTATFYVLGAEAGTDENVYEGDAITFPSVTAPTGYTFMGWTDTEITTAQADAPADLVTSANMGTSDVEYYAVFAVVSGTPATLTKMASNDTFADGDNVVIVAVVDEDTSYGLYQKESTSKYIDKYLFDGKVATVASDNLNWITVNSEDNGTWSFGDDTNGYLYNPSSNDLKLSTTSGEKTSFTVAYSTTENGFYIKNGARWFAYRADLQTSNQLFRMGGNGTSPITGTVGYFDIYKYVAGSATYSDYCTTIPMLTVTIDAACNDGKDTPKYYGTFSSSSAFVVPENLTVSEIGIDAEGKMVVSNYDSGDIVPANTGVMLSATTSGDFKLNLVSPDKGESVLGAENRLRPTGDDNGISANDMGTKDPNCLYYRLTMHEGTKLGFWWGADGGDSFAIVANKAYLAVPTSVAGARNGFAFGDDATGISNVNVNENVNGSVFDLQGRKVSTPGKGLYIVNGKKVVIK